MSNSTKYIFDFDSCMIDLLELHLRFVNDTYYIFIMYFPANKRLYLELLKNKTPHNAVSCFYSRCSDFSSLSNCLVISGCDFRVVSLATNFCASFLAASTNFKFLIASIPRSDKPDCFWP